MEARSKMRQAAIQAEADVQAAGLQSAAQVQAAEIKAEAAKDSSVSGVWLNDGISNGDAALVLLY